MYWCGPLLGGIAAGFLYDNIFSSNASFVKAKNYFLASSYDAGKFEPNAEKPLTVIEDDDDGVVKKAELKEAEQKV